MTTTLARMGAGFADPVHGAQQTFRALLVAMSEPGRLHTLPASATDGLVTEDAEMRPPLDVAMSATLLTLLDADTPVHLAGTLGNDEARGWLRFHTGARAVPSVTGMTAALAGDVDAALWSRLDPGTDDVPQAGATLFVEVDALSEQPRPDGIALTLHGAGIETSRRLVVAGLSDAFWRWRVALQPELPRGIDLVLVCGRQLAAIPRSTRITFEA